MTELKQTEINFDAPVNENSDSPVFKLKVTNIRKSAYPTNSPQESDLFKFKIGDFVSKNNAIFQVVSITREPITQNQINVLITAGKGYINNPEIDKTKLLFEEYKKNGNFGVCRITIKPLIRGSKEIAKGKLVKFIETDQIRAINYNGYIKVDLPNIVKTRDYWIASIKDKIKTQESRLKTQVEMRDAVLKLINPPQTQVVTTQVIDLAVA